jgi:hypothetical protein
VPALVKTTSYVYRGDEEAARKLHNLADLQLMKLRNLMSFNNLDQYSLTIYNKIGAYVKVSSNFGVEVAEIFYPKIKGVPEEVLKRKRIMRMKIAQDWTILYAPCPLPEPQDWEGWFESGKTNLVVDNFLDLFGLISWGRAIWGDFTVEGNVNTVTLFPTPSVEYGGWVGTGEAWVPGNPTQIAPVTQSVFICRNGKTQTRLSYNLTFPYNLVPPVAVSSYSESGTKVWHFGGTSNYAGYASIPSNPIWPEGYACYAPPPVAHTPYPTSGSAGYNRSQGEGYISWQSLYLPGFWKMEWVIYNPSSYLDEDNYVLFYDYYTYTSTTCDTLLEDRRVTVMDASKLGSPYTPQMITEYHNWGLIGLCNYVEFPNEFDGEHHVIIHDPDMSTGADGGVASINYVTHVCGKYEGVWFDEIVGAATWAGTAAWGNSGTWSGDNVFPWMARFYPKEYLREGTSDEPNKTSSHNLLLFSYLTGPAAGYPSSTDKVPGCTGITNTTYRMRHGDIDVTASYPADHPGWHTVWGAWKAYGDIFAAAKDTVFKSVEVGPPEWVDWWYADGSQFIIEEDDN